MCVLQYVLLALLFINCVSCQNTYSIPHQKVIVTEEGFRISIPDESGIQTFFFQGNVNKYIDFLDPNVIILSATAPINGEWSLEYKKKGLKPGDFINYWIHLRKDGIDYTSRSVHYQIKNVLQPSIRHSNFTDEAVSSTTAGSLSSSEVDTIFGPSDRSDDNASSNHGSTEFPTTAASSSTTRPLSPNEEPIWQWDENTQTTPKSTSTSTLPYQWVWPDD